MIIVKNQQRKIALNSKQLRADAQQILEILGYPDVEVAITCVSDKKMQEYNHRFRAIDKPTDVLSFPFHPQIKPGDAIPEIDGEYILGDIMLAPEYIQHKAPEWGRSFDEHLQALLIHGMLHLLGYDHIDDTDHAVMQKKEDEILSKLKAIK